MTLADILPIACFFSGGLSVYLFNYLSNGRQRAPSGPTRCQACGCAPDDGMYSGFRIFVGHESWSVTVCRTCLVEASASSMRLPLALERIAISAKTQRELAEQVHAKLLDGSGLHVDTTKEASP